MGDEEIDWSAFTKEVVDRLRDEGWVLIPPDRARQFKMMVQMVMDVYLETPPYPEEDR